MNLEEFRKSPMSGELAELLRHPTLATAMQIASESAPVNNMANISQVEHVAHIQHGIDKGYALYPSVLKLMASPPEAGEVIEPTYAPVEQEQEELVNG